MLLTEKLSKVKQRSISCSRILFTSTHLKSCPHANQLRKKRQSLSIRRTKRSYPSSNSQISTPLALSIVSHLGLLHSRMLVNRLLRRDLLSLFQAMSSLSKLLHSNNAEILKVITRNSSRSSNSVRSTCPNSSNSSLSLLPLRLTPNKPKCCISNRPLARLRISSSNRFANGSNRLNFSLSFSNRLSCRLHRCQSFSHSLSCSPNHSCSPNLCDSCSLGFNLSLWYSRIKRPQLRSSRPWNGQSTTCGRSSTRSSTTHRTPGIPRTWTLSSTYLIWSLRLHWPLKALKMRRSKEQESIRLHFRCFLSLHYTTDDLESGLRYSDPSIATSETSRLLNIISTFSA